MSDLTVVSSLGTITISRDLVAEIVAEIVARCYGVVGLSSGSRVGRLLRRDGITVAGDAHGLRIGVRVVVEYGLNLAEVASTIRSQVSLRRRTAHRAPGRGGRGVRRGRPGQRMRARLLELSRGALAAIEAARARIDDLNVYPVPDGDTGTNLTLTVRAVVEALELPGAEERTALARELSRAALMGARGNSGVILSQIVRGAAESLGGSDDLAAALRGASDAAYRAVRKPVEGTMLTAIRELAEEAERGSGLEAILARGDDCVLRTERMLPVLAEAGVVDAGAAGLVEILRGIASALAGQPLPQPAREAWAGPSSNLPPGAVALHLLHRLRGRGRGPRRRARSNASSSRSVTRSSSSATRARSRRTFTPTTPGGRSRSPSRAVRSPTWRSRTCTCRRSSVRGASYGPCPHRARPARSSPSSRAPATRSCSRASARTSSTAAAR